MALGILLVYLVLHVLGAAVVFRVVSAPWGLGWPQREMRARYQWSKRGTPIRNEYEIVCFQVLVVSLLWPVAFPLALLAVTVRVLAGVRDAPPFFHAANPLAWYRATVRLRTRLAVEKRRIEIEENRKLWAMADELERMGDSAGAREIRGVLSLDHVP